MKKFNQAKNLCKRILIKTPDYHFAHMLYELLLDMENYFHDKQISDKELLEENEMLSERIEILEDRLKNFKGIQIDLKKTLDEAVTEFERKYIIEALKMNQWNISKSAKMIGKDRTTLHAKIKKHGITST